MAPFPHFEILPHRFSRKKAQLAEELPIVHNAKCLARPVSFTATNTENFFCESHPINCSILLQRLLRWNRPAVYARFRCSAFIASLSGDWARSVAAHAILKGQFHWLAIGYPVAQRQFIHVMVQRRSSGYSATIFFPTSLDPFILR
jgi:hypothetical protein